MGRGVACDVVDAVVVVPGVVVVVGAASDVVSGLDVVFVAGCVGPDANDIYLDTYIDSATILKSFIQPLLYT